MRRTLVMIVLVLASWTVSAQGTSDTTAQFRWLDRAKDNAMFEQILVAFADELKPDDPEKVKPVVPQLYKRISRVGVFGSSALVLIAERETATDTSGDYYLPYNYDLKNGKKEAFEKGFPVWKFKKFVQFEPSATPDITFTYVSCTECEADYLLGSFRFDSADHMWKLRTWGEKDDAILIGSDTVVGSEEGDYDYECLYKFADFTGDGFDDVGVRCIAVGEKQKILEDRTSIYTVEHGRTRVVEVKDALQLAAVQEKLCTGIKKSKLCPPK